MEVSLFIEELHKLQELRRILEGQLERSLLIQSIWPDAFHAGKCRSLRHTDFHGYIQYTLIAGDGDEYQLSKDEVRCLEPDAKFSDRWVEPQR